MWHGSFTPEVIVAWGSALLVLSLANPIGRWLRVMDHPDPPGGRKRHRRPTPQVGGLALLVAILAYTPFSSHSDSAIAAGALSAILVGVLGFWDDRTHVSPWVRLSLSAVVFLGAAVAVKPIRLVHVTSLGLGLDLCLPDGLAIVLSTVSLLALQNSVNMADGRNGLVAGLALVWTAFFALLLNQKGYQLDVIVALGGVLFLIFTFNVLGNIFLGDCGSYALSAFLGIIALACHHTVEHRYPTDVFFLWFFLPVLDCGRLMVSRLLKGRSPFEPDMNHFHHRIERLVPWRYGLPIYLAHVAVPGVLAFYYPELALLLIGLVVLSYTFILLLSHWKELRERSKSFFAVQYEAAE